MTSLLEDSGDSARSSAFESLLANMSHDMAKGKTFYLGRGFEEMPTLAITLQEGVLSYHGVMQSLKTRRLNCLK